MVRGGPPAVRTLMTAVRAAGAARNEDGDEDGDEVDNQVEDDARARASGSAAGHRASASIRRGTRRRGERALGADAPRALRVALAVRVDGAPPVLAGRVKAGRSADVRLGRIPVADVAAAGGVRTVAVVGASPAGLHQDDQERPRGRRDRDGPGQPDQGPSYLEIPSAASQSNIAFSASGHAVAGVVKPCPAPATW